MDVKNHRKIFNAHVISSINYGMPIWGANLNLIDKRRLNSALFRLVRLHCRDFSNILSFRELSDRTGIRSLTSLRTLSDSCMLYKLITCPLNTEITLRLIQQCTFSFRYPNKLVFFDFSTKKLGSSSFMNRAKKISETISFEWHDISFATFKYKLKKSTPIFML